MGQRKTHGSGCDSPRHTCGYMSHIGSTATKPGAAALDSTEQE